MLINSISVISHYSRTKMRTLRTLFCSLCASNNSNLNVVETRSMLIGSPTSPRRQHKPTKEYSFGTTKMLALQTNIKSWVTCDKRSSRVTVTVTVHYHHGVAWSPDRYKVNSISVPSHSSGTYAVSASLNDNTIRLWPLSDTWTIDRHLQGCCFCRLRSIFRRRHPHP